MSGQRWAAGALSLSAFVLWLLAFPMEGALLPAGSRSDLLFWFLVPHTASLILTPVLLPAERYDRFARIGVAATVCLTVLFPFVPRLAKPFLAATGIFSVFALFNALELVRLSPRRALAAATGVAGGNAAVFALSTAPVDPPYEYLLVSAPLLATLSFEFRPQSGKAGIPLPPRYLLPLFLFFLTGGLLYGFLLPLYEKWAVLPGSELLAYVAAVPAAAWGVRRDMGLGPAAAALLGAVAFSLLVVGGPWAVNFGMFASQASFAVMDLFTLLLVAEAGHPKAYGTGFGAVCAAIATGKALCLLAGAHSQVLIACGNVILLATLAFLYAAQRRPPKGADDLSARRTGAEAVRPGACDRDAEGHPPFDAAALAETLAEMYTPHQKRLSAKEKTVLLAIVQGKTYRETAVALGISESSVKTYAKRISEKLGVAGKDNLVSRIAEERKRSTKAGRPPCPGGLSPG